MSKRVLIADDSAFARGMLKNCIKAAGMEVAGEAADGNEAVALFQTLKPDIVLLDIMMPQKNGLDALRDIMQIDSAAKVVMCTSVGQEKVIQECIETGAADFVVKPFHEEDIKNVLEKLA